MPAITPISSDKAKILPDPSDHGPDLSMTPVAPMKTSPDIVCLYGARALRGFGDGFAIIILPVYLSAIGLSLQQIGIVASASLLGTAALTLIVGFIAPRFELRKLFLAGAGLIVVTGTIFPATQTLAPVLLVAFVGSINPSGGDLGMLVPLEHALLMKETADKDRTRVFARYSLIGSLTAAVGSLAAALPDMLAAHGWPKLAVIRLMFYGYAALGLLAALLYRRLPRGHAHAADVPKTALGPSRNIVYRLAALFSLDAFAGGFVVQSLLALWLFQRFDLSLEAAGMYFFCSSLLGAVSFPVAAWLAGRVGLVNTMVFTHIPSSVCLIVAAFSSNLTVVMSLLLIRSALSQMDVPTRSSYVMAVVTPAERAAAASVTVVPRSLASSISPAMAGFMLAGPFSGLPLVVCGCLKIAYDLELLRMFRHTKPPEER
jgi:MFS family permease